jgi:hypothetical protein
MNHVIIGVFAKTDLVRILKDKANVFEAEYKDRKGHYIFKISKKAGTFTVNSDGRVCHRGFTAEFIKWDFEMQLAGLNPKVLQ